jgi:glycosyltransferase involved in cell wall biosynthesis
MKIRLTGAANAFDGYGYITENLALALDKLGVDVQINPVAFWYDPSSLKERTKELIKNRIANIDLELLIIYPTASLGRINKRAAILTMWEANVLPIPWVKALHNLYIPILAPSKFSTEVFLKSKIRTPVIDFPLGVDKDFYPLIKRNYPKDRPFRFLSIGKFEPRKNGNVLISCFREVFKNNPNIELYIKTREHFLPGLAANNKNTNIKFLPKTITEEKLRELYFSCDCFVYPSRGEAFSFPPRNAILTGMPTIVTDWSALAEILGSIKIDVKGLSPMYPCGFSYGEEKKLLMADIDEAAFCSLLRYISEKINYLAESNFVKDARKFHLSWEDCARNLIMLIEKGKI